MRCACNLRSRPGNRAQIDTKNRRRLVRALEICLKLTSPLPTAQSSGCSRIGDPGPVAADAARGRRGSTIRLTRRLCPATRRALCPKSIVDGSDVRNGVIEEVRAAGR